jgi:sulfopyruvate decarboxylase TPP-binding subunit
LFFAQSSKGYRTEVIHSFYTGFQEAGIDFAVFLPDATMDGVEQLLQERGEIETYQCSREDEGIAMAMGAYLGGRKPVMLMEGSGVGMSALILARGVIARTPILLIVGHCSTLGERYDYHAATLKVVEPTFQSLGIPYHVLMDAGQIKTVVVEAQHTIEGQKLPFAIVVPTFVLRQ